MLKKQTSSGPGCISLFYYVNFPNSYRLWCSWHSSAMLTIHIRNVWLVWRAMWQKSCSKTFTCVSVVLLCSETLQGARMAGGCAGGKARTHPWKLCGDTLTPKRKTLLLLYTWYPWSRRLFHNGTACRSSILLHTKDIERVYTVSKNTDVASTRVKFKYKLRSAIYI